MLHLSTCSSHYYPSTLMRLHHHHDIPSATHPLPASTTGNTYHAFVGDPFSPYNQNHPSFPSCGAGFDRYRRCQCQCNGYLWRIGIQHFSTVGIVGHFAIPDHPGSLLHLVSVLGVGADYHRMLQGEYEAVSTTVHPRHRLPNKPGWTYGWTTWVCLRHMQHLYSFVHVLKCSLFLQCCRDAPDCTPQVKHTALAQCIAACNETEDMFAKVFSKGEGCPALEMA